MNFVVREASFDDAEEILTLQRLCYRSEAELYDDWEIPPLTQTLESLRSEYETSCILAAYLGSEVVGSVRGRLVNGTYHIGRLIVHPRLQRLGVGTRLMREIEARFTDSYRYELFTGHLSEANLRLYRRLGYTETRRETVTPSLRLVYLSKVSDLS